MDQNKKSVGYRLKWFFVPLWQKIKKSFAKQTVIKSNKPLKVRLYTYRWFYFMFIPVFAFMLVFKIFPLEGIRYAFYEYRNAFSINWVGLDNFKRLMSEKDFWIAFKNTLELSIIKLLMNTGFAVLISLLLNEIVNLRYKKITQTIIYLPHFISWVVTASIFAMILSISKSGFLNSMLIQLGFIEVGEEINFMNKAEYWRGTYYVINLWRETGWQTIIFLATLAGINPELYEAAHIDGASRFKCIQYITLPSLANTIITVLILNLAKIMNLFESVFVMQPTNASISILKVSNVIQTYTYNITFASSPDFGFSTAVSLFRSLIGCVLVLVCNYASKKVRGRGIV